MKKTLIFFLVAMVMGVAMELNAQTKPGCNPSSCGPSGTKTEEAKAITDMRQDLQVVISKLAKSGTTINEQIIATQISQGSTDDESLLYIYQTAFSLHTELIAKVNAAKLLPELKSNTLQPSSNKQQLVANLKKEIKLLADQVEKL
jgi:hypothetical protein